VQPPFDIAADLDTPVSVYLKLAALSPRFLLESVESGFQLARYSFLGFGGAKDLRLDERGLRRNGVILARPGARTELLGSLRDALRSAPELLPVTPGLPFAGGLVGVAGYDIVRYFERLSRPPAGACEPPVPECAYLATESLLVFDHLTRRIALLRFATRSAA
jgi:anthranilate synthase component 1